MIITHFGNLYRNPSHPFVRTLMALYGVCSENKLDKDLSDLVILVCSQMVGSA